MNLSSYDQFKNIINNHITVMLNDIKDNNIDCNTTILKQTINEVIKEFNTGYTSMASKVSTMFAGRGRAWAKVLVDDNNEVWNNIKNVLDISALEESINLLDVFESTGFAWMRFVSVSGKTARFCLRTKGSKIEKGLDLYINISHLFNNDIVNLEGVPHSLGLEQGVFTSCNKKHMSAEEQKVDKKELNSIGITLIEDLLQ